MEENNVVETAEDQVTELLDLAAAEDAQETKGKLNVGGVLVAAAAIGGIALGARKLIRWVKDRKKSNKENEYFEEDDVDDVSEYDDVMPADESGSAEESSSYEEENDVVE